MKELVCCWLLCYTVRSMPQMIIKEVQLTKQLDHSIIVLSRQQGKPEAEVIRDLLETGLKTKQQMNTGDALLGLAKLGETLGMAGPTDLSERHDDYLYGDDK